MFSKGVLLVAALCFLTVGLVALELKSEAAAPGATANGQGGLSDGTSPSGQPYRRVFAFSARTRADGTVDGTAVLHNPAFDGQNGNQPYSLHVDISCMKVIGNVAFFGGTTRRTTDPNLVDAVYWSIEDNGNPGAGNDRISRAFFFDDDPNTTGDPQLCQGNQLGDFPMEEIQTGNISLRP